jgi:glycosyltransferase involved in cell wall biosynthesis
MTQRERAIRLLGLTMERAGQFRSQSSAKSAGLYAALDRRYSVVGVLRPAPSTLSLYLGKLRHLHPDRDLWRAQASLSPAMFRQRSAVAERMLHERAGGYDLIVQLHTLFAPGRLDAGRPFVLHTDNTYMLSERHFPPWAPLWGRAREEWLAMEGATYRQAAFLFPRSEFLRRSLVEDYGCDPARVIRVGGGANFPPLPLDGKRYDGQIALFVGSDFARKGGMALLDAWEQVAQILPAAQLWIVGPKRPLRPPQPGVRWIGRVSDRAELARLYAQATLFVMPSLFEPWGHVFLEAMASGLPCIGSDHGATPEIIGDGRTGLLVRAGQPDVLTIALVTLLRDPGLAEELGRRAQRETAAGHSWDDVAARMAPYIERAAGPAARQVGHA